MVFVIYCELQRPAPVLASAATSPSSSKQSGYVINFPLRHLQMARRTAEQTAESVKT